jgi:hypothetical protein
MYIVNKFNPFFKKLGKEDLLQNAVVNYAEMQHQAIAIPCNTEGKKTTFVRWLYLVIGGRKGTLDLFFPYARGGFHGLFIELKKDGVKIFKKDGSMRSNEHLERQHKTIQAHRKNGYKAEFAIGFEESKDILDNYFKK